MPKAPKLAERGIIRLVGIDFEIDPEGRIWRIRNRGVPCSPSRAEYECSSGYLSVSFASENVWAHRLVYQHFYGDIPDGLFVNHKNGVKSDNRPENLEAVTHSANRRHGYRVLGEKRVAAVAKLTPPQVAEIRGLARSGQAPRALAARYGVTYQCVQWALHGRTWRTAESGYDPAVHKFTRTGQRGYKLSSEAARQMLSEHEAGASMQVLATKFRVSIGTIAAAVRRERDGEVRTTEQLQRQRQKFDLSPRQIEMFRSFAEGQQELRGGSANWLLAKGWVRADYPSWPPSAAGTGTITEAGRVALHDVERRLASIDADASVQGRARGPRPRAATLRREAQAHGRPAPVPGEESAPHDVDPERLAGDDPSGRTTP